MSEKQILSKVGEVKIDASEPFNFLYTVWKPSHFPTALEAHSSQRSWRTFRLKNSLQIGVVMSARGKRNMMISEGICVEVFSNRALSGEEEQELHNRLKWSYNLDFDLAAFYSAIANDVKLQTSIKNLYGMRSSCPETVFEILVISLILQNTTVARSTQMLKNLLSKYGDLVEFDGKQFYVFCDVNRIANATQDELRGECRLGYRAKYLPSMAQGFVDGTVEDAHLRSLSDDDAHAELKKLKGVGPYSAHTVISLGLQRPNFLNLDSWNTKIFSAHLFNHTEATKSEVESRAYQMWGKYRGLAGLYIIEDIYREKPVAPLIDD